MTTLTLRAQLKEMEEHYLEQRGDRYGRAVPYEDHTETLVYRVCDENRIQ